VATRAGATARPARRVMLLVALALTAAVHAAVFGSAAYFPVAGETERAISPLTVQRGVDFGFYYDFALRLAEPDGEQGAHATSADGERSPIPGIVLPLLLLAFDYGPGHTLPLALGYLALGTGFSAAWLWWLWRQGLSPAALGLFAVLPGPIWLTLNISTDMPFAVAVAAFALAYFGAGRSLSRWAIVALALVVAVLVRPNGIFLFLFLLAAAVAHLFRGGRPNLLVIALGAIPVAGLGYYYYPYLLAYLESSQGLSYFGRDQTEYLAGAFPDWPAVLDLLVSWSALLAAKVLYFAGLRPSYGETAAVLVAVRAAPGLILLPGLIWLFARARLEVRLFVGVYLLPFVFGAAQDRYNLAITPFLFYYGIDAWARAWTIVRAPVVRVMSRGPVQPRL